MENIDRSGIGGVDGLEDRTLLGNCGTIVGTEDCRVVVAEDCRTGGEFNSCSIPGESHSNIFVVEKMQQFRRIAFGHMFEDSSR